MAFDVDKIQNIEWNEEAFDSLVLPHDHKYPSSKLITKKLDLMISSRVKDTELLLTSLDFWCW